MIDQPIVITTGILSDGRKYWVHYGDGCLRETSDLNDAIHWAETTGRKQIGNPKARVIRPDMELFA